MILFAPNNSSDHKPIHVLYLLQFFDSPFLLCFIIITREIMKIE